MGNDIGVAQRNLGILVELPNGMSIGGHQPTAGTDLEGLLGTEDSILLDPLRREVYVEDNGKQRKIHLRRTEFNLLEYLMRNAGRAVPHDKVSREVFRYDEHDKGLQKNVIGAHVGNLRKKLGDNSSNPMFIENIYGVGYKFIGAQNKG